MKLTKTFVCTALIASGMISCGSALAQDSTNASAPASSESAPAQTPQVKSHGADIDKLAQKLNLTDDQKAQIQPILKAEHKKMKDLRNDTSLSDDERRAKMKEIRKEMSDQLQPILTADQFAQYKSMNHGHHSMPQATPAESTNAPAAQ